MIKPIYTMRAAEVGPRLYSAVKEAVQVFLTETEFQNDIEVYDFGAWRDPGYILNGVYQKYKSIDWYLLATKHFSEREDQFDAGILLNLCLVEPWQIDHPHYEAIVVADDLYHGQTNFIVGLSGLGLGMVVSAYRFMGLSEKERIECLKTVALHELGHVFGAVRPGKTQNVEESLGSHCTNVCVMRQGLVVPGDWLKITADRLRTGRAFCEECLRSMREGLKI
jgi:predicted Zn-dependent protease